MKELVVKCLICGKIIKHITDTMYYDEAVHDTQLRFDCHQLTKDLEVGEHFFIFGNKLGIKSLLVVEIEIRHVQYSDRFRDKSFVLNITARSGEKCNNTSHPYDLYRTQKDFSSHYMSTELSKDVFVEILQDNMTEQEKPLLTNDKFISFAYESMIHVMDKYRDCLIKLDKEIEKIDSKRFIEKN